MATPLWTTLRRRAVLLLLLLLHHQSAAGSEKEPEESVTKPLPLIVIADVGVDDGAALLMALGLRNYEVVGVAASFGCHRDVRVTARNALRLLRAANRTDVPVHVGSRVALGAASPPARDGTFVHGVDGFGTLRDAPPAADSEDTYENSDTVSAAEFIVSVVRENPPGQVTIACLSPMTNLALAVMLEPALPSLLRRVVAMGGVVAKERGNVSPHAEANFWLDAAAARLVVRALGPKLVLAPLDVTEAALVDDNDLEAVRRRGGPAGALVADAWPTYADAYCAANRTPCGTSALHDTHTIAYLADPTLYGRVEHLPLDVRVVGDDAESPDHGGQLYLKESSEKNPTEVAVDADAVGDDATVVTTTQTIQHASVAVLLETDAPRYVRTFIDVIANIHTDTDTSAASS